MFKRQHLLDLSHPADDCFVTCSSLRFPGQRMNIEIKQIEPEPSIVETLAAMIDKQ
jgi:hypothetical protein